MKPFYLAALFILSSILSHAQDTLHRYNGKVYLVKVEEIRPFDVKYQVYNKPGTFRSLSKSEIKSINYTNGTRDSFIVMKGKAIDTVKSHLTRSSLYQWGRADAKRYYSGSKAANTGTFLTAFLVSPAVGLIPALACVSAPPLQKNLQMPNPTLAANTSYYDGYAKKARSIKSGKVWLDWGIGSACAVIVTTALILAKSQ